MCQDVYQALMGAVSGSTASQQSGVKQVFFKLSVMGFFKKVLNRDIHTGSDLLSH